MKKTLLKWILPLLGALIIIPAFTSCSSDDDDIYFITDYFTVRQSDWVWNDIYGRWEYLFPYSKITDRIYDAGLVKADIYVVEDGYDNSGRPTTFEVAKPLPFIQAYDDEEGIYEENITFDYSPGYISFSIQSSNPNNISPILATYQFKVSLLRKY